MSGQFKISNGNKISVPSLGKVNSYELNGDTVCFFIKNHYLYPLEKSYNINLPNSISVNPGNELSLKLKIPKQIFSENYIYELNDFEKKVTNLTGGLQIKSSDGCINKKLEKDDEIEVQDLCGWIVIKLTFTAQKEICNICEINYSIFFDHFKLKMIKGVKTRAHETEPLEGVKLNFDICNTNMMCFIIPISETHNLGTDYAKIITNLSDMGWDSADELKFYLNIKLKNTVVRKLIIKNNSSSSTVDVSLEGEKLIISSDFSNSSTKASTDNIKNAISDKGIISFVYVDNNLFSIKPAYDSSIYNNYEDYNDYCEALETSIKVFTNIIAFDIILEDDTIDPLLYIRKN